MLTAQFAAIPVPLSEEDGYHIHPDKIAEEIARGTGVIITSNPRNPTGLVVQNPELAEIQDICRERATLVSDEFYSGYNYTSDCDGSTISAAVSWLRSRLIHLFLLSPDTCACGLGKRHRRRRGRRADH